MESVWQKVKSVLKERIPSHSYMMWVESLEYVRHENGIFVISCPNFFIQKRIREHYKNMIESELINVTGTPHRLLIEISKPKAMKQVQVLDKAPQIPLPGIDVHPSGGRLLRKNFTFDRFVVSENNNFAYSAAITLASQNNPSYNSLYLISDTGNGKSHLSQAIGHHILSCHPKESVYYITAEDFTNEMVDAFRHDAIDKFKQKYRNNCDVLLLEDVHFLTGKDRTQLELALALDYLLDANKMIIFSSCLAPADIPRINDQLRSRLSVSLITDIKPPDFNARIRILQQKLTELRCRLPKNVTEYLAGELSESVRQLENGLIGLTTKAALLGKSIDISLAKDVVRNISQQKKKISIDIVKQLVCQHYNISLDDIVSKSRKQTLVRSREMAIYLSRKFTNYTFQQIAKSFNRYHATAIRSFNAVEKGIRENTDIKKQVEYLCERLSAE